MYIVDSNVVNKALQERGYKSLVDLAASLNVHRNTINYYLSGRPVLPEKLCLILDALDLSIGEALIKKDKKHQIVPAEIGALADQLHEKYQKVSFFLFGSRARRSGRKYSDYDIGVYSKDGIRTDDFISMSIVKDEIEEDLPWFVDLVNLNNANRQFLANIKPDIKLIAGRYSDYNDLNNKLESL